MSAPEKRDPERSVAKLIDDLVKKAAEAKERERRRRLVDPDDVEIWPS